MPLPPQGLTTETECHYCYRLATTEVVWQSPVEATEPVPYLEESLDVCARHVDDAKAYGRTCCGEYDVTTEPIAVATTAAAA